jgi:hypothetical protein
MPASDPHVFRLGLVSSIPEPRGRPGPAGRGRLQRELAGDDRPHTRALAGVSWCIPPPPPG